MQQTNTACNQWTRKTTKRYRLFIAYLALVMLPTICPSAERTYSFGVVPQFTSQVTREIWMPILSAIEKRTGLTLQFISSATIPAFETQVMVSEFDFAYMNPYIAFKVGEKNYYQPLVRDIAQSLYGILVVRKNSKIHHLKALNNQLIAFPAPNALGASLIIKAALADEFDIQVRAKYVQTHSSVYLNVALGRLIAGGGVQKTFNKQDKQIRDRLKIIYRSKALPSHPVAAHKRVPQAIQNRVKNAFLTLGETKAGRQLLSNIPIQKIGVANLLEYKTLANWNLDRFYVTE